MGTKSVAHPQANGQVEAVNKTLKSTLKKRLEQAKGAWPEELPKAFWSYRTTARTTTGHSPFSMAYGFEAMIPVEVISVFVCINLCVTYQILCSFCVSLSQVKVELSNLIINWMFDILCLIAYF